MVNTLQFLARFFALFLSLFLFGQGQLPKLIGLKNANSSTSNSLNAVTWTLGSTTFDSELQNVGSSVVVASSFYDAFNGSYYASLPGNSTIPSSLLKFNTNQNTVNYLNVFNQFGMQETVVDMQNGKYYFFQVVNGIRNLYVTNASFSNVELLGEYPNVSSVLVKSTTFDSNNKIFYYLGIVQNQMCLIKTFVANSGFSYQVLPLNNLPAGGQMFIGYSNVNDKLYTIYSTGNYMNQTIITHLGELNTSTAEYTNLFQVPELVLFVNLNVSFDQSTRSFVVMGSGYNFSAKIYWANVTNGQTAVYNLPTELLYEVQCDNNAFALDFYQPLNSPTVELTDFKIFPNPTTDFIKVNLKADYDYEIYNLLGQIVLSGKMQPFDDEINVNQLENGIYHLVVNVDGLNYKNKFIKN